MEQKQNNVEGSPSKRPGERIDKGKGIMIDERVESTPPIIYKEGSSSRTNNREIELIESGEEKGRDGSEKPEQTAARTSAVHSEQINHQDDPYAVMGVEDDMSALEILENFTQWICTRVHYN